MCYTDKNDFFRGCVHLNLDLLRQLPKMDRLLAHPVLRESCLPYPALHQAARDSLDELRGRIRAGSLWALPSLDQLAKTVANRAGRDCRPRLCRVINATGVVLHTNLGRAPLSPAALEAVIRTASGYSNLEYNLEGGTRGSRHAHVERLLRALTDAEGAMAVNNNAAAVFLMLSALAQGKGVAISRGELVEIGGSFRVPDILARSGAQLVEVGTTNKTRLADYAAVLDSGAAQVLLKVHPSNFQVVGFTEEATLEELAGLAQARNVPLLYDLGSASPAGGLLAEAARWADVVCFSGDKLLGGPQAGLAVGRTAYIDAMKRDPLARVVRIDKLSLAALEATLLAWHNGEGERLPVPAMLGASPVTLRGWAHSLAGQLAPLCPCAVVPTMGEVGGGSLPGTRLDSWAVELPLEPGLEDFLRGWSPPILGRIHRQKLLLDVRTLLPGDGADIAAALAAWKERGR